jgi:hypothetical protein
MAADTELHRSLGRMEGELEGIVATLKRVDERSAARDATLQEMAARMGTMEHEVKRIPELVEDVSGIRQMARDGKMTGKGVLLGFGLATAAGGATLATFFKQVWLALFGA